VPRDVDLQYEEYESLADDIDSDSPPINEDGTFDESYFQRYLLGVRTLWIEVIRRAAFDWVLYRNSNRMSKRKLAQDAFIWLFVEDSNHPNWQLRIENDGCPITSFIGICDALDLDPEMIREGIRRLTPTRIKALGKLPMRRPKPNTNSDFCNDDLESRVSCAVEAARFLQEIRLPDSSLDDEQDIEW